MPFRAPKWVASPARRNRQATLQVEKGGECIEQISVGPRSCYVLGRSEELSDVWLQHPSISRQHAVVAHDKQERVCLMDLGSAQGTFVNGQEIEPNEPRALKVGDRITFGASTRIYQFQNQVEAEEAEQKQSKETGTASQDPELQRMMREMQSFGDKHHRKQESSEKQAADAGVKAGERKKRQAEIEAMTAHMMHAAPQVSDKTAAQEEAVRDDSDDKGPQPESESDDDDDDDGDDDDNVALRYGLPKSHEVGLESHTKGLGCIAVDTPGARVATGSMDYHVKLWDFAGMARHVRPFRDIEVDEGHPLVGVSYSPSGDRLLAVTGSSQPKVLTREGVEELQFAKGDMYVVDMTHTNGHTHTATAGQWHPTVRDQMITSSLDGTVRLWNLGGKQTFNKLINTSVFKFKDHRGRRCGVTACRFNPDGSLIAGATMDGQVQCIDPRKAYAGAALTIRGAHADGGGDVGISSIRFSPDGKYIASRSCADDSIKIWDVRKTKQCVKEFHGIEGVFGTCNIAFNHNGTAIAAGTCVRKGKGLKGQVLFLDVQTPGLVEPVASLDMKEDESAVCVEWHHGINQIFVGSSTGTCRVFYDPRQSTKGVLLSATKKLKVQNNDSGVRIDGVGKVYNPHALSMYRDETSGSHKRKYEKVRADPKKSHAPEKPITGPGMGGKISGSTTFTQYFMSSHIKSSFREEDPREAILKYAKAAEKDPQFLGAAYKKEKLDPRYQLAKQTLEEEKLAKEEEDRRLLQP
ncbi:WD repeat-containing protein 70 [Phytophthora pseudosyringae]|uniref:WD repeat-containing protein 70 n=1 Tax=Phytophthora pseudosyringae TaxID=221518 RepID=A0A8T1WKN6_9STRA|nr:WD repeat-containing protein 70 [Phytophthora pseudosyringae]